MGVKFKVQQQTDSPTKDVVVRISVIANGFVIKAGDKPYYCTSQADLKDKVCDMLDRFAEQAAIPEAVAAAETKPERRR